MGELKLNHGSEVDPIFFRRLSITINALFGVDMFGIHLEDPGS